MSQAPAMNIAVTSKDDESTFFRATCECCSQRHDHNIVVELDKDSEDGHGFVTVSIYQDLEWAQYPDYKLTRWKEFLIRLKNAWTYLRTGEVKVEGHFLMSYESARDYAAAIDDAAQKIKSKTKRYDNE